MQDYYNMIPKYLNGKALVPIVSKLIGNTGFKELANSVKTKAPRLAELFGKYIGEDGKVLKNVNIKDDETKELVKLLQKYRNTNIPIFKARAARIDAMKAARNAAGRTKPKAPTTEAPTPTAPNSATTSRWEKVKDWMKKHPVITVGTGLGVGTGIGRRGLGKVIEVTQYDPWADHTQKDTVVTINGVDIPVVVGKDGKLIPKDQKDNVQQKTNAIDSEIDNAINSIKKNQPSTQNTQQQDSTDYQIPDQQDINDLFSEDQWY